MNYIQPNNLNIDVYVEANFTPDGQITPTLFELRKKDYPVENITFKWEEREGDATLLKYTVESMGMLCSLGYNNISRTWTLYSTKPLD